MLTMTGWGRTADGGVGLALHECLSAAAAAPSIHNTQPWRFRVFADGVDVIADPNRRLQVIDPMGRELMISVGAALLNLRVAVLAHGRTPMQQLLPDPDMPELAARVQFGAATTPTDTVQRLYQAIPRRHTIRKPFTDDAVPPEVMTELARAAEAEDARLVVLDDPTRASVLALVRMAERLVREDPGYWRELAEWTHPSRHRHDGVPPGAFGPWSAMELLPLRDFGLLQPIARRKVEWFESQPTIAVLYTTGDSAEQWLRAGEALERTLLTACVRGVSTTLMTQPLEIPALRGMLDQSADGRVAQAIIRLGYGPHGPSTPRRPVEDLLLR